MIIIAFLKRIKNIVINVINKLFVGLFRRMKLKNRAFFYSIRSDGKLLENADFVYRNLNCEKVVFAKMLPHTYIQTLKVKKLLLTSRVIVTDDYLKYLRIVKLREGQKVVQLWHAGGAFKKFALDAPSKLTAEEEKATHSQYTDVCVTSDYIRRFYAGAFGVDLSVVKALGSPRTDAFFDKDQIRKTQNNFYSKYPDLKDKKLYTYFPTFREKEGGRIDFDPEIDWVKLNNELEGDELFIVSRHPVMKKPFFENESFDKIIDLTHEKTPSLLMVSSAVITDYSSIIFDASLLELPMVFYCPDYDTYERDFYLDFEYELPGEIVRENDTLLTAIRKAVTSDNKSALDSFRSKEMSACDGHSTERIVDLIKKYLNS